MQGEAHLGSGQEWMDEWRMEEWKSGGWTGRSTEYTEPTALDDWNGSRSEFWGLDGWLAATHLRRYIGTVHIYMHIDIPTYVSMYLYILMNLQIYINRY